MNPVSIFKSVARQIRVEDSLEEVKKQARADAESTVQRAAATFASARALEASQVDAAYDRNDRASAAELAAKNAFERSRLTVDAADARARASAFAGGTNTHFDNAIRLDDPESARAYLESPAVQRLDLLPSVIAGINAKKVEKTRTSWDAAVKAAKTMTEISALRARPEFQQFGEDASFVSAEAGAREADRRWKIEEARRAERARRAGAPKAPKGTSLSLPQRRLYENDLFKSKQALRNAVSEDERADIQDHIDALNDILASASAPAAGGNTAVLDAFRKLFPQKKP